MAKRQRETDKKLKADDKRKRRDVKKTSNDDDSSERSALSTNEVSVLTIFQQYLMTPGQMLCLSDRSCDDMEGAIGGLMEKGMLTKETFESGYSLTPQGFMAMKRNCA